MSRSLSRSTGMEPLFDPDEGLRRFVILIIAMITGGLLGEALKLEERLESLGEKLRTRLVRSPDRDTHTSFIEGFVVASTVFCVGPLTIVGAVEDGLGVSIRLLAIKSALDGFAAIGFASVYGWGVLASLITLIVYQGGMTAAAALVEPLMTEEVLATLGAVGKPPGAGDRPAPAGHRPRPGRRPPARSVHRPPDRRLAGCSCPEQIRQIRSKADYRGHRGGRTLGSREVDPTWRTCRK